MSVEKFGFIKSLFLCFIVILNCSNIFNVEFVFNESFV